MRDRLTPLQREVLDSFFAEESEGWFLTGGAALARFYLGHRETHDLDLFTVEDRLASADRSLRRIAERIGALLSNTLTSPDFLRRTLTRANESVVVDLVRDHAPQLHPEKVRFDALRVDAIDEIFANKLCALLSRSEIRDVVDVMALERAGCDLGNGLRDATRKDGGMSSAQLAHVLSQLTIGDDATVPAYPIAEVRSYLRDLIVRLTRLAHP